MSGSNVTGRLCFVGAGFHASTNIFPSAVEAGAEIAAIATRNKDRSTAALVRFGSQGIPYDDVVTMLHGEVCDGVVVVAQPSDQINLAIDCIRAGKNVLVDKPLGMSVAQAMEVEKEAKTAGVVVMVGFMKRHAPIYKQLQEIIVSNDLGKVCSFEAKFACDSTPFCKTEEEFVKFAAIHFLDLVRFLFGEVEVLTGFHYVDGPNITQCMSFKMTSGAVGSVTFHGMTAYSSESEHVNVTFENGSVSASEITTLTLHKSLSAPSVSTDANDRPWKFPAESSVVYSHAVSTMSGGYAHLYQRGFVGEIVHFIDCCKSGAECVSSAADNVLTMELCERVLTTLNK